MQCLVVLRLWNAHANGSRLSKPWGPEAESSACRMCRLGNVQWFTFVVVVVAIELKEPDRQQQIVAFPVTDPFVLTFLFWWAQICELTAFIVKYCCRERDTCLLLSWDLTSVKWAINRSSSEIKYIFAENFRISFPILKLICSSYVVLFVLGKEFDIFSVSLSPNLFRLLKIWRVIITTNFSITIIWIQIMTIVLKRHYSPVTGNYVNMPITIRT